MNWNHILFLIGDCFKAILSKALGYAIISGSVLVKVPQILKIFGSKSGKGLNMFSLVLELCAITFTFSYSFVKGFPFSAYGDSTFLGLQTVIIGALVLFYGGSINKTIIFVVTYFSIAYALISGLTPIDYLWNLQACNIPILVIGKLSQAYTNYSNKSTGQLSATTCFMLLFGSIARIFTSIQETGDNILILMYCVSTFTNGVIVSQLIYYWNSDDKKEKASSVKGRKMAKKIN